MSTRATGAAAGNLLIAAAGHYLTAIIPHMKPVELVRGQVLCEAGGDFRHVYFPCDGSVLSLMSVMRDGAVAETVTVGREGAVGLITGMCSQKSFNRCMVQMSGVAYQLEPARLNAELERNDGLRQIINCYIEALLSQVLQSVACNALHAAEARLCRWLLMMHDRFGSDTMPLTQEFLAEMLGLQRTTVSHVAKSVQAAGLIRYRRGSVEIIDRAGLEQAACECYGIVRRRYRELLPPRV